MKAEEYLKPYHLAYKDPSDRDSYSSYREGYSDAMDIAGQVIEQAQKDAYNQALEDAVETASCEAGKNLNKMKEFVVTFKTSRQISPDDWDVYNPSMKVTETTTVKEISDFFCKHIKREPVEVKLIELQQSVSTDR